VMLYRRGWKTAKERDLVAPLCEASRASTPNPFSNKN